MAQAWAIKRPIELRLTRAGCGVRNGGGTAIWARREARLNREGEKQVGTGKASTHERLKPSSN